MKKVLKSLGAIALAAAVIFGGTSAIGGKAFAASTSTSSSWPGAYGGNVTLVTSEDASNIYASTEMPYNGADYVSYTVQKLNSSEAWLDVETKYGGYADYEYGVHKTASVTFYNYGHYGSYLRVVAHYYEYSNYTGLTKTVYGNMWQRN